MIGTALFLVGTTFVPEGQSSMESKSILLKTTPIKPTFVILSADNNSGIIDIYKEGPNYVVSHYLYNDTDADLAIQIAMKNLSNGGDIFVHNGTYTLNETIILGGGMHFHGQGNNTVLDFSNIGHKNAIVMGNGSSLTDIKISGSINPLPKEFTQKIYTGNNTRIDNIVVSNLGYGIELEYSNNVTLSNIRCEDVRSKQDWAACIHTGQNTLNVSINGFTLIDSDRGIEMDAGAKNVTAQNGYEKNIKNYDNTGHEAFSLDVHSHDREGGDDNITYKNVYLENSFAPTTKDAGKLFLIQDLPRNVLYQNITLVNPISPWQVDGVNVTIRDSRIINSTHNIFEMHTKSRNILIERVEAGILHKGQSFVANFVKDINITNVKVANSKIIVSADNPDEQVFHFTSVDNLILENNTVVKNGVVSNAAVPEFPRLDWIVFVIALSCVPMTRLLFKQTCRKL